MGKGFLQIKAATADEALPIANANVKIYDNDGRMLLETSTNADGMTPTYAINAPDASLTLNPHTLSLAYSTVYVVVSAPGYVTEQIGGVEIVDTQLKILPINMKPLASEPNPIAYNYSRIAPLGVLTREDSQVGPFNDAPLSPLNARALPEVIIPDYITVHLGAPSNASARNVRVKFSDYIKNVASHEIYSTWPQNALITNIHAIVTFALNRIYTEWYRNRGYNFDITNNTNYDMNYVENGGYFQNISQIVDGIFNTYAHRYGFRNPFFTLFCAGASDSCAHGGMPQWGTVTLANQGMTPLQILRRYYTPDMELTASNNITGITESFPGTALNVGSSGEPVRRMQNYLNRIRVNYPLIPRIENPNGVFGTDTAESVRVFQRTFGLTPDGIIGRATWNKISQIYTGIARLGELDSEGSRISIGQNPPNVVLSQGARGNDVLELQFILNTIAAYYNSVPMVIQDGVFDARTRTAVMEFQKTFGLPQDGVVGPATWNKLYAVFRGIWDNVIVPPTTTPPVTNLPPYPGTPLKIGSSGENVRIIQEYLNVIRTMYPNIPALTVDGIFGSGTQNAVIAFQRQFMLTPDGIVGPTTWNKIMEQFQIAAGTPTQPLPPPEYFFYTVQRGDTLWLISHKFDTTVEAIKQLNGLTSDLLNIGQILKIPGSTGTSPSPSYFEYTVVSGDTLWRLAQRFGTTVDAIMTLSGLTSSNLSIGQVLKIPQSGGGGNISKTIVIDAGHGGSDPGAVNGTRLEKNDNLNLALAVQKNLQAQGQRVIMTRNTDVFVPLEERSAISNRNNADLFVSLHRNSGTNPAYNGVDNFVYTTAPQSTFQYAQNVINEVANVGVQSNRGVSRENFAVLRNTNAPAMLLEMGFISNAADNQLFDQNFDAYAAAITRGILNSLGVSPRSPGASIEPNL